LLLILELHYQQRKVILENKLHFASLQIAFGISSQVLFGLAASASNKSQMKQTSRFL
jgi:hypothetical protein